MGTWARRRLLQSAASAAGLAATTGVPAWAPSGIRSGHDDVVERLRALPGLRVVEERPGAEPGHRFFVLGLRQPVDHRDPAAGTFEQRLLLLHTCADRPTVLFTTGYEAALSPRRAEPTVLLGGNQLQVEHRYFGTSRPAALDYRHLTVRQAADDHHRVVRLFRAPYPGAWISTGGSKGGMAGVHHRRFHPHDVDGTVAYSAPNNVDDRDDSAHLRFLDTVGTAACRDALRTAQRQILLRRADMAARYQAWAASTGTAFDLVGSADKALEIAVLRAAFMFWQKVPPRTALPFPARTRAPTRCTRGWTTPPHCPSTPTRWHGSTSRTSTNSARSSATWTCPPPIWPTCCATRMPCGPRTFVRRDIPMRFDSAAMPDSDHWVRRRGSRLLFVNGTEDPAVAESFHPDSPDSRVLWAPGATHHATIGGLSTGDRAEAVALLTHWTAGS